MTDKLTRARVLELAKAFSGGYPFLASPDGAVCRCGQMSRVMFRKLDDFSLEHRKRRTNARLLKLSRPRLKFPRRHKYWKKNPRLFADGHVVLKIGVWTVDLTRRQFDPRSPHPFVQHIDKLRQDWRVVKQLRYKR